MTMPSTPLATCRRSRVLIDEMRATMSVTRDLLLQSQAILAAANGQPDAPSQGEDPQDDAAEPRPLVQKRALLTSNRDGDGGRPDAKVHWQAGSTTVSSEEPSALRCKTWMWNGDGGHRSSVGAHRDDGPSTSTLDTLKRLSAVLGISFQAFLTEPANGEAPRDPASAIDHDDARLIALFRALPDRLSRERCLSYLQDFVVAQRGRDTAQGDLSPPAPSRERDI